MSIFEIAVFGTIYALMKKSERMGLVLWLANMLQGGYPLARSLKLLGGSGKSPDHLAMQKMAGVVEQGSSFTEAVGWYWKRLPRTVRDLAGAGEEHGVLGPALLIALELEAPEKWRHRLGFGGFFFYALIFTFVFGVLGVFVLPVFEKIFADFGGTLPDLSQAFFDNRFPISGLIYYAALALVVGIILFFALRTTLKDVKLLSAVPGLGRAFHYSWWWRVWYGTGRLMQEGLPLDRALAAVGEGLGCMDLSLAGERIRARMDRGADPAAALAAEEDFPPDIRWVASRAEISGDLAGTLAATGESYRQIQEPLMARALGWVSGSLFLLLFLAACLMVAAMYLPIFWMAGVIG